MENDNDIGSIDDSDTDSNNDFDINHNPTDTNES